MALRDRAFGSESKQACGPGAGWAGDPITLRAGRIGRRLIYEEMGKRVTEAGCSEPRIALFTSLPRRQ